MLKNTPLDIIIDDIYLYSSLA